MADEADFDSPSGEGGKTVKFEGWVLLLIGILAVVGMSLMLWGRVQ